MTQIPVRNNEPIHFNVNPNIFAQEDIKLEELKNSSDILDRLTAILMEAHADDRDTFGLYYNFARVKAAAIMEAFDVKDKSSPLP